MHFFKSALAFAFLAASALAQSTQITAPPPGTQLVSGTDFTVQVFMGGYPENIDVVAIVIGLAPCFSGVCDPPTTIMGEILYQGPYTPVTGQYYANYTLTVPENFPSQQASLNLINLFLVGAEYAPVVDYVNEDVTVVAC